MQQLRMVRGGSDAERTQPGEPVIGLSADDATARADLELTATDALPADPRTTEQDAGGLSGTGPTSVLSSSDMPVDRGIEPVIAMLPLPTQPVPAARLDGEGRAPATARSSVTWIAGIVTFVWLALAMGAAMAIAMAGALASLNLAEWGGLIAAAFLPVVAIWGWALARLSLSGRAASDAAEHAARMAAAESQAMLQVQTQTLAHRVELDALAQVAARIEEKLGAAVSAATAQKDAMERATVELSTVMAHFNESAAEGSSRASAQIEQFRALFQQFENHHGGAADQVDQITQRTRDSVAAIENAVNKLKIQSAMVDARLGLLSKSLNQGLQEPEARLARLEASARAIAGEIGGASNLLGERLGRLTQAGQSLDTVLRTAMDGLDTSAAKLQTLGEDGLTRLSDTLEQARSGIDAQAEALSALVGRLDVDTARVVARLGQELAPAIELADARANAVENSIARMIDAMEAKSAQLATALDAVKAGAESALAPVGESSALLQRIEASLHGLRDTTQIVLSEMRQGLEQGSAQADALGTEIDARVEGLMARIANATASWSGMKNAIALDARANDALMGSFGEKIDAVEKVQSKLTAEIRAMTEGFAGLRRDAEQSAQTVSLHLIEAMARSRKAVVEASSAGKAAVGELEKMLHETFAKPALADASRTLAAPLVGAMAEIDKAGGRVEAQAQAVQDRVAATLARLEQSVRAAEKQIGAFEEKLDARVRTDFGKMSFQLIEALNSDSIDIAKALSTDLADGDWESYLAGDRSLFTRKVVKLVDRAARAAISRKYEIERDFQESVQRYIRDFETLMSRAMLDREGSALSVALLSSDIGKLYVALAQSINRLG